MIIIEMGDVNDVKVFGMIDGKGITALTTRDFEFCTPNCEVRFDSGCYPSIDNLDQYFCDKAFEALVETID